MQGMNIDRIGDELAQAYEDGYQRGLEENKENNYKLRNLQITILADAENRKESKGLENENCKTKKS